MSANRYPKRRRVSERNKEATPPPEPEPLPQPAVQRYTSSPDELAGKLDHQKFHGHRRPSQPSRKNSRLGRASSQPKRGRKEASSDELNATLPTVSKSATEVDPNELILEAATPKASSQELQATAAADAEYRRSPESPAISPLSVLINPEELPDAAAPFDQDSPDKLPEDGATTFQDPFNDMSDAPAAAVSAQNRSDELAIGHTTKRPIPTLIRTTTNTTSTFRGSFSRDVERPIDNRYISTSPPPYSRISTPIATPREFPTRPPQYVPYRQKMVLKGHKGGVAAVRFSPNGRLIASCSADATIRIWDTATGKHLHTLEGHLAGISTIAWSPDSKTLASGSDDKSIRLWDVSTGKAHPHPLQSHSNYVYALSFSPRGNILASGSYDEALFLWDVRTTRLMRSLPAHSDPIGGVDFIHDGTLIVSCASDGLIRIWDTATGQCLRTLVHEDNAAVTSVRFSPNGTFVLAWTLDSSVRLWNYKEGRCVKTYQGHKNEKYSIGGAFGVYHNEDKTEERAFVVTGCESGDIYSWDVQSKEILQKRGGLMVSGGLDKTIRIWESDDGMGEEKVKEEEGHAANGIEETKDEIMVNGEGEHHAANGEATAMDVDVKEIEDHVANNI
ncbi:hypothetical protein OEA41_002206 [Lepraria neglecta]|uniref:Mitochondrial division protein 1 n=1 Tax=Lepraria neglecta TaxID=209136 RepID=A0AAE0DMJ8_9LECA|nr:hypothetical protein OEA41_002206 [Lepraria neglecta]